MSWETIEFEGLLEAVPDALVGVDQSGLIRFVNRQTESLFGYDRDDLVGQPLETLVPESLRLVHEAHREGWRSAPRTGPMGTELELSGQRRDGSSFPVECSLSPLNSRDGIVAVAALRDMTRYQREDVDRSRADLVAGVVEYAGDAIIGTAMDGTITSWNPAAEKIYGYSSREIIGKSSSLLTPEDHAAEQQTIRDKIMASQDIDQYEGTRVRKDGTAITVSLTASPIRDANGALVGISTTARNVSAAKLAYESAQRMAAIVMHSKDAIISSTIDGIVTSWNPAAERLYGYSSQEMIGKSAQIVNPKDRVGEVGAMLARVSKGQPIEHMESIRVRKDGTTFPVSATVSPIRDPDGVVIGASVISRDVTVQRQAYESARSMIESSLDAFVAISPEGLITDANEATVTLTGVSRETLLGTSFSGYFTDPEKAEKIYQLVFSEGMAVDYPLTVRKHDGQQKLTEVRYNASVYRDTGGRVLGVFAAARDVTNQMEDQRRAVVQQALELERLAELEHFQRLTVGRELRMIELKKEIEYLRKFGAAGGDEPSHTD